ncbi:MAG: glycerol-3-phosphate acyltransferase, partial [Acidimicrobiia bacterium]|nr:glycerol-3-phosphate acyltransferase [Acidimicrobiia bacterium]
MSAYLAGLVGYLVGSISFARIVGAMKAPDVRMEDAEFSVHGTEETWVYRGVSATTAGKRFGARWGVSVAILDGLKALIPILLARAVSDDIWTPLAISL